MGSRFRRFICAIIRTSTSTPPEIVPDNIEPTKIKRSAFIAAASGYYLAAMPDHGASLLRLSYANAHARLGEDGRRAMAMAADSRQADAANIVAQALRREQRRLRSLARFVDLDAGLHLGSERDRSLERGGLRRRGEGDAAARCSRWFRSSRDRHAGAGPESGGEGAAGARRRLGDGEGGRGGGDDRDRAAASTATTSPTRS